MPKHIAMPKHMKTITTKRPYDRKGAKEILEINRERAREGLSPIQRKRRKTTRKYVFSGKFAGQNGGKRCVYRSKALNRVMANSLSAFVDASGKSVMPKRVAYQGKYPEWWSRVHGKEESKKNPCKVVKTSPCSTSRSTIV